MLLVAVKTGLGVAAFLIILGVTQSQSISETLLSFIAAGVVPGTNITIPPDIMIIASGVSLVALSLYVYRRRVTYRAAFKAALPPETNDRPGKVHPDPYATRLPRWQRIVQAGKSSVYVAKTLAAGFYAWLKSYKQPALAKVVALRRLLASAAVHFGRWVASLELRDKLIVQPKALGFMLLELARRGVAMVRSFSVSDAREKISRGMETLDSWAEKAHNYLINQMLRILR